MSNDSPLRNLPSISSLLDLPEAKTLTAQFGSKPVTQILRSELDILRQSILENPSSIPNDPTSNLLQKAAQALSVFAKNGRQVINATGIILHTGLGRSPLSPDSINSLKQLGSYSLLEVDAPTGDRGTREREVELLLQSLVSCEAATVLNNNAAATFMALRAIAAKKEVIISRGQLIEIGGSYRLPEVMRLSSCKLKEIGTTNITRLEDYDAAVTANTGAILHVHTSNYRIQGFHSTPTLAELRTVADKHNLPLIEDLGSGALVELTEFGLTDEQLVSKSLADGADVVCFSGDKLVGGPQAGIVCGKKQFVSMIRKNQFFRMFRPEKLTLLALETTLLSFARGDYSTTLPIYKFLSRPVPELRTLAEQIMSGIGNLEKVSLSCVDSDAYLGGGTLPEERLPSAAIKITPSSGSESSSWANKLATKLRTSSPRIFPRIEKGSLFLDLKTVTAEESKLITSTLKALL